MRRKFVELILISLVSTWLPFLLSCRCQSLLVPPERPDACSTDDPLAKASEQDVADRFFQPYGSWHRPRLNSSDTVITELVFVLSSIVNIDETARVITLAGYLSVHWMDEFRTWMHAFPYNCVDYVVIPADQIWVPDIAHMNADGKYDIMSRDGEKVRIYSNGFALYSPGGTFQSYCHFDLTMFPFDIQNCTIHFVSWRYTHQYVSFIFGNNITQIHWIEHEIWELVGTEQLLLADTNCEDPDTSFDRVNFSLKLRRRSAYYFINIIIPSSLIAIAHGATFALPVGLSERLGFSFVCLMSYTVLQTSVSSVIPRSSTHIPLMTFYLDLQMGYITLLMLGEGAVYLAMENYEEIQSGSSLENKKPVSQWLLRIFTLLGRLLLIGPLIIEDSGNISNQKHYAPRMMNAISRRKLLRLPGLRRVRVSKTNAINFMDDVQQQWRYVAFVLDRFLAVMYTLANLVTPLVMFTYPLITRSVVY